MRINQLNEILSYYEPAALQRFLDADQHHKKKLNINAILQGRSLAKKDPTAVQHFMLNRRKRRRGGIFLCKRTVFLVAKKRLKSNAVYCVTDN